VLAVAAALTFGVAAAHQSSRGLAFFLIVAPMLPLAGVAVAFGPGVDPTYEIGLASPMRSLRLLLVRAAAVLATTAPLAAAAGLLLPVVDWAVRRVASAVAGIDRHEPRAVDGDLTAAGRDRPRHRLDRGDRRRCIRVLGRPRRLPRRTAGRLRDRRSRVRGDSGPPQRHDRNEEESVTQIVRIQDARKRFGSTRAVDGVSMEIGPGITGLLGPNGAGKTTLLRILATVLPTDDGRVSVFGLDPSSSSQRTEIRRRLGYMPQEPGFHRGFTAFEFVDYIAILKEMTNRRARRDEVRRVLAAVGLEKVSGKKIRTLSGGMRRRVAVAQALLGEPDLLILDEPTAGLDPEQRLRFREMVSALAENRVVLLSTHQTEDVAALCNRVVVMDHGGVPFEGSPRELADVARGRVWYAAARDAGAHLSWRTGDGRHRNVGDPPAGAELTEPTIEDGYLLLIGESVLVDVA
jgi:ABC-2 type transport system ATP-binding protein